MTPSLLGSSRHDDLPCPNPYCDGYGWVRVDATAMNHAYVAPACKLGPHPVKPNA